MILSYFQRYRLRNYCDILFVGDLVGRESEPSVDVRKKLANTSRSDDAKQKIYKYAP